VSVLSQGVTDQMGRGLRDLRVSVTDRCNLRCTYCMPREVFGADYAFLPRTELLTFEEIARVVAAFTRQGVRKVRLTGGEPLLRRNLDHLVAAIAAIPEVEDLALTTNGVLLADQAEALHAAGLQRVTVSLDALDQHTFAQMGDTTVAVQRVLDGIGAAQQAGLGVKVNAVMQRGVNEAEIIPLADFGRTSGVTVRFIEYMDVGETNGWQLDQVIPAQEVVQTISAQWPVEAVGPAYGGEVANRYRYLDGHGEFGVIASVTQPFCGDCTRARLSAKGEVFTCLYAAVGHDLRDIVRSSAQADSDLDNAIARLWGARDDQYSALRSAGTRDLPRVEMSYIGG